MSQPLSENSSLTVRVLKTVLPVFGWILGLYAITQLLTWHFFDLTVWTNVLVRDAFVNLVFGSLLYALSRGFWPWAIAYTMLALFFQFSNALKYAVLGSPIMPDDFTGALNMFLLFDDWRLWALIAAVAVPLLAWINAIAWKKKATWAIFGAMLVGGSGFVEYAVPINRIMDKNLGDRVWDQPGNYRDRGLIQHVLHETSRSLARGRITIDQDDVLLASEDLFQARPIERSTATVDGRNVHIILLESFFDPMVLEAAGISEDPVDPRFRALWAKTGNSTALAPVFGGFTANSEFEILCGFPSAQSAVFFEGWLRNRVPCLPQRLSQAGYTTVASHPNYAAFWNRVNSYDRIGFDEYWAMNDFALDDMNGPFLSDESLYRQINQKLGETVASGKPVMNYVVTYFGHMDYPLNDKRPQRITVENDPNMVERYVNTVYYKTRELMDYYEALRQKDPEALIVIFGDHLPFLGPNYDGYVESGLLVREKSEFTPQMFLNYTETPLIIVNGTQGLVEKNQLPMYRLPSLIAELLGDSHFDMLDAADMPEDLLLRPLPGITLVRSLTEPEAPYFTCVEGDEAPACQPVNHWLENVKTLRMDLFSGEQLVFAD